MRKAVVGILVSMLLLSIATVGVLAQEAAPQQQPGTIVVPGTDTGFDPNQPIKPGFQLSIEVKSAGTPEPDLSGAFQVDASGSIQMKLVGLVQLRGLTPPQAADKIAALLKPYIKDPTVTVTILSVPKPVVFLSGGVTRPGATQVNDGTTLAEVLTIIGFTDNADLSKVRVVHRDEAGNRTMKEYNFLRWLKPAPGERPDESQNPVVADKDMIYVPLKTLPGTGNVYVEGAVVRPGVVPIRTGQPVLLNEALALAGGLAPTADRRNITVRRMGAEHPYVLDYGKIEAGDPLHNMALRDEDIVYVRTLAEENFINMNGAFIRPGKLPYTRPFTLTQAISEAGGLQPTAKEKEGRVFRHVGGADPTKTQIIAFNYGDVRKGKQPDILLEPGDTVEIPQGFPPRPPLDPLQIGQILLNFVFIIDRLSRRGGVF
jgi:protein involved in polysaccharide export with SLBB domain